MTKVSSRNPIGAQFELLNEVIPQSEETSDISAYRLVDELSPIDQRL